MCKLYHMLIEITSIFFLLLPQPSKSPQRPLGGTFGGRWEGGGGQGFKSSQAILLRWRSQALIHLLSLPTGTLSGNMYGDSFFPGVIKRLMGLTEGVDMDTLVTIILADALICPYQSPLPISRRRLPARGPPAGASA